jgi:hypothetical protein
VVTVIGPALSAQGTKCFRQPLAVGVTSSTGDPSSSGEEVRLVGSEYDPVLRSQIGGVDGTLGLHKSKFP